MSVFEAGMMICFGIIDVNVLMGKACIFQC